MAESTTPYDRDGESNAWNKLIRDINELAAECDLDPLEEVEECHRWSKEDITKAQDKLKEICDDNTFSEVKDTWKVDIVQELEDAIEAGSCCESCPNCGFQEYVTETVPPGTPGTVSIGWLDNPDNYTMIVDKYHDMQDIMDEAHDVCQEISDLRDQLATTTNPSAIANLQSQIDDKETELDDKIDELDPIADEMETIVDTMIGLANTSDGSGGQYDLNDLFTPFKDHAIPYLEAIKSAIRACPDEPVPSSKCRGAAFMTADGGQSELESPMITVPKSGRWSPPMSYFWPQGTIISPNVQVTGVTPACNE